MKRYEIKYLLKEDVSALMGTTICVKGWEFNCFAA